MTPLEVEKLRMSLIQSSLVFLDEIADPSYLAFSTLIKARIKMILEATPEILRALNIINLRSCK